MKARLIHTLAAGCVAAAGFVLAAPIPASAAVPGSAEGDAYAAYGQAFLLGTGPVFVGPLAQARATVPPGVTQTSSSGLVNYDSCTSRTGPLCNSFQQPLIEKVDVPGDNGKATIGSAASTECAVPGPSLPPGFNNGALTGGNACAHVANAGLLNTPVAGVPVDFASANAVDAQSTTQSCTATPTGRINILKLAVGGTNIIGGASPILATNTPAPNTVINLAVAKVILNEQVYDSAGHGLTVNAIHIFTTGLAPIANADVIVAHAHSEAICSDGSTTDTGNLPGQPVVPTVTKTDSTKHANPGEAVTYTISIDNHGCPITSVTDILPAGFHFIGASGPLGVPGVSTLANGQQQLFWSNGGSAYPLTPNPLVETVQVSIDANAPAGQAINNIVGTSDCGTFAGSDLPPLTTSTPANNGPNPGIIVPRPGGSGNGGPNTGAETNGPGNGNANIPSQLPFTGALGSLSPLYALGVLLVAVGLSTILSLGWRTAKRLIPRKV